MKSISTIILAAGVGKRMHSRVSKMLHYLAGKPLLEHVIQTAHHLDSTKPPIVVVGHQSKQLRDALSHCFVTWVEQEHQLGTAHALLQALPHVSDHDHVLVLYGDVPLISLETLKQLVTTTPSAAFGMLVAHSYQPTGYGRIKRNAKGRVIGIIEEKDATEEEQLITEINPGIYFLPARYLKKWLPALKNNNAQQEYYLTDIVAYAVQEDVSVYTIEPATIEEILGVNDRIQLAHLERFYQRQQAEQLMRQGVTICDPARLDVRGEVQIGQDVCLDVNVILEGRVVIGDHCIIGPHTILRNVTLGKGVEVKANSIIDGAEIASDCVIGPFARIRPGTVLASQVHVGNFVELKNSIVDEKSKINHLSYIGDGEIGKRVNIGAGTITCNYDGMNKHKTIIGDDAFIGSDTQLIAPVIIGEGAVLGAGSTLTKNAPAHKLTLTHRLEQRSKNNGID
ncbi:MAG: UDP-N-acetylglucosamine diphosphorylase/glucosamine-1-phosphate N-acetyltransferase [Gammaproteobacteria bacterium RIFCSPHIGHO2_12_FULL_37_34]|nr:MAG: UDP-N-acetylglucosamine diphosphorylase/glucosamine-1-phosphate N-acetyltransferase [Gammaproteobacteria bacterium RIFCSPHIGHO2_12_FULL_37_34]